MFQLLSALPYFIFLAIVLWIYNQQAKVEKPRFFTIISMLTLLVMVLFAGLRDSSVGTDTGGYVRSFLAMEDIELDLGDDTIETIKTEPGYEYLVMYIRIISDQYWVYLSVVALICYSVVLYSINRYSDNRVLSLFIYITLGYYTFCFNAARQAIALSIYLLALPCIHEKRFLRYCVIVCIGALFHKSILISIPLYFLFTQKYSKKSVIITIVTAAILSQLLPSLLSSASEIQGKYRLYATAKASGGYLLTTFYTFLALFFIYMRSKIAPDERKEYDVFLQMLICGSVIYLIVSLTGSYVELTRFAAYFQIASIFLFAKIWNTRQHLVDKTLMRLIYVMCLVFLYVFVTTMAALTPYHFNQTLWPF